MRKGEDILGELVFLEGKTADSHNNTVNGRFAITTCIEKAKASRRLEK